jgi:two-component system LytT family response regulator
VRTLRALIVDDEPVARQRLKRLLHKVGDVMVVAECDDGTSAVAAIRERDLDLVFLDVQMPQMSGFDVVRAVGADRMPAVVFVTAFDRFALPAFEAQALDYLLKPFGEERLRKALSRAQTFLNGTAKLSHHDQPPEPLTATGRPRSNCLLVRDRDRTILVRPPDIDWVEADADYVRLHVGPETHLIRSTLTEMEERLVADGFLRIHRSRLVNLDRVKELRRLFEGESVVVLKTGVRLKASQSCLRLLQERLGPML